MWLNFKRGSMYVCLHIGVCFFNIFVFLSCLLTAILQDLGQKISKQRFVKKLLFK